MYESRKEAPLPHASFVQRLLRHLALVLGLLALSLLVGMSGYVYFEQLHWLDAFLNAAMLLGGMGPVHLPVTAGGKFFAGCYALYAGLVFIAATALVLVPILHRVLHKFHWE